MNDKTSQNQHSLINQIVTAIKMAQSIGIVGHIRPDGDCIGSQLGLAYGLKSLGKKVSVLNSDPIPERYLFLDPSNLIDPTLESKNIELLIVVDTASIDRIGNLWERFKKPIKVINIDHHPTNTGFGQINWIEAEAPATTYLIYKLYRIANWQISKQIANCLLVGLVTDTGSFQFSNTNAETLEVAAQLVKAGADISTIALKLYHSQSLGRVKLLRHLYKNFRLSKDQRIAWLWLRSRDFKKANAQRWDSEDLIDHLRAIKPVVIACIFEEIGPKHVKISLRCKDPTIDLSNIAAGFGGGGHQSAAGARIKGHPKQIQRKVLLALRNALHSATENQRLKT